MARLTPNRALRVLDEWKREWVAARGEVVVGTEPLSAPASRDVPRISEVALSIHEKALEAFEGRRRQRSRDDKDQDAHIVERQADLRRLARRTLIFRDRRTWPITLLNRAACRSREEAPNTMI